MEWTIEAHPAFATEFDEYDEAVREAIIGRLIALKSLGPQLGRPHVDTLNGSRHANMKELRCSASDGVWRVAFAFDPERKAILLAAGDKAGVKSDRFYKQLIAKADDRFDEHLTQRKGGA